MVKYDPLHGKHIPNFSRLRPFQQRNALAMGDVNLCVVCGCRTNFDRGKSRAFVKTCCNEHANIVRKESLDQSMIKIYGVKNALQVPAIANRIDKRASQDKRRKTICKKYGGWTFVNTPNAKAKTKQTNQERYGFGCIFQTPSVRERCLAAAHSRIADTKRKYTNISRYGVGVAMNTPDRIAKTQAVVHGDNANIKRRKTMQNRFGGNSPFCSPEVCEMRKQTMLEKYGVEAVGTLMKTDASVISDMEVMHSEGFSDTAIAQTLGISQSTASKHLRAAGCQPYQTVITKPQVILEDIIHEISPDIEVVRNDRIAIHPLEIDVFVPKHSLGIELNGAYWHSERTKTAHGTGSHYQKFKIAQARGIHLLQIFDYELMDGHKVRVLKNLLNAQLSYPIRVGARNTVCRDVPAKDSKTFLDCYHWQRSVGAAIRLGLYKNDELIQLATFGRARFASNAWELLRVATRPGYSVTGGLNKLLTEFKRQVHFEHLITYSDNRLFTGASFARAGFSLVSDDNVGYVWWKDNKVLPRYKTTKKKLRSYFGLDESVDIKEIKTMHDLGFMRVYDAGQSRWEINHST